MIRLFEAGKGFIVELEESRQFYAFCTTAPLGQTKFKIDDLEMTVLTDDCGKSYSTRSGVAMLEYVDRI